jgi:hypothetical protein
MTAQEETSLTAKILDLKNFEELGRIEAPGSGKSELGMIVNISYFPASAGESDTCAALARRIVELLCIRDIATFRVRD